MAGKTVRIDALPESAWRYRGYDALICIDLLLAGTTAVTAAASRRATYLAATEAEALELTRELAGALTISDSESRLPGCETGFGLERLGLGDPEARPVVLVTELARIPSHAAGGAQVYFACLRNLHATARHVAAAGYRQVAVLGVGEGGEVRCEDQMAAVWLAQLLEGWGFSCEDRSTRAEMARWRNADVSLIGWGRSAERLREAGREDDVNFVMRSMNDLNVACRYESGCLAALSHSASHHQRIDAAASGTFG